ncbi:kleisin alpha PWA37_001550 [Arxiozyma heterogenica]|uniref:kleisin alpha n=1 Tax=Arxiozyma heterogenica TaxID=278026 RepID=UPI002EF4FF79
MDTQQPSIMLNMANNQSPLAQIWLASNMSNVSRTSVLQTDISKSVRAIEKVVGYNLENRNNSILEKDKGHASINNITLRTSGELLHGVVRVYSKQAGFLLSDIKDTLIKISSLFKASSKINVTMTENATIAKIGHLILEDTVTEKEVLVLPTLGFLDENISSASNLLNKFDNMERQVQGATKTTNPNNSFDISIEVGRRFDSNEGPNIHENSNLDLDFDIQDVNGQNTSIQDKSSWIEGTRNTEPTVEHSEMNINSGNTNYHDNDWNLDFGNNEGINMDTDISHDSIELGRRAESVDIHEPTDFGFDLELEKEQSELELEPETEIVNNEKRHSSKKSTSTRNPLLKHTIPVESDFSQELTDEELKNESLTIVSKHAVIKKHSIIKLNQKRLWEQMIGSLDYIPNVITTQYLDYRNLKKPKVTNNTYEGIEEPEYDNSLDLDANSLGNGEPYQDLEPDIIAPLDADITNQLNTEEHMDDNDILSSPYKNNNVSNNDNDQHMKLPTSENINPTINHIVETLKMKEDSILFNDLVVEQHTKIHQNSNPISKREASDAFFNMLTLATTGCVDLVQEQSFGKIHITKNASLLDEYIIA